MENSTLGPNPPPIEMEKNKVIFSETTPALFVKGVFSPLKITQQAATPQYVSMNPRGWLEEKTSMSKIDFKAI